MASSVDKVLIFTGGAIVGSLITWLVIKTKQEQEVEDAEIEEVVDPINESNSKEELSIYKKIINENRYNYSSKSKEKKEEEPMNTMDNIPYVISPDAYGEIDDYEEVSYTYYEGDGVLTDEFDEIVEDIDYTIGSDFKDHFGEYDEDTVYIRNDSLQTDYKIERVSDAWNDINPHE